MTAANNELPAPFKERLAEILPPERFEDCWQSFAQRKRTAFRVNGLLADSSFVAAELKRRQLDLRPITWLAGGYSIPFEQREVLTNGDLVASRQIYIQNPSSAFAVKVLDPQPGEMILDLAAAPGGKTILIAEWMKNEGQISAVESVRNRFFRLKDNLDQHGVKIAKCYLADGRSIGRKTPERFDRVLLDAPCSGESRIHATDPKSWRFWSEKKIKEAARKQKGLIRSALACLKPGGRLVYCTCSFAPEENEAIVGRLLREFECRIEIESIDPPIENIQAGLSHFRKHEYQTEVSNAVRVLPDNLYDGFFVCRFRKN